tara:strand:+ start:411 stop:548 length:138 start_codon:yes stop_codon:yes gene_type:complete
MTTSDDELREWTENLVDMLDWIPVQLSEEEAWEILSQQDENGELI